ncbi:MAG: Crp/Fnr family transcriptional regulator [Bilophila wadsworthia]
MKPLKLDADSSRTGKLEDMNAPWSRLLHLATRYTYPKRYPLVLAGDAMFDFYYLAKGRLRIMHGAENGRERAMVYIGSGNVFNEATALAGFDDPDCRFYCMEDVELYRFPARCSMIRASLPNTRTHHQPDGIHEHQGARDARQPFRNGRRYGSEAGQPLFVRAFTSAR